MTAVYVHYLNIQRFEELLASETDAGKRATIQRLLDEERSKNPLHDEDGPPLNGAEPRQP